MSRLAWLRRCLLVSWVVLTGALLLADASLGKTYALLFAPAPLAAKEGKLFTNAIGMKLVRIPAGTFTMGSTVKEREDILKSFDRKEMPDWLKAEGPQHEVEISKAFYLGIYEVTQKQFKEVMGYNPSHFSADGEGKEGLVYEEYGKPAVGKDKVAGKDTSDFPVENVSWEEAVEFCKKLNKKGDEKKPAGHVYRLPREAEWEYSCRAGASSTKTFHVGASLSSSQANFNGNRPYGGADKGEYLERTCKVDLPKYKPNRFGLYDMHGNVYEWCADWYDEDYYGRSPRRDPEGPPKGWFRVIRGGSWNEDGLFCRSAHRNGRSLAIRDRYLGFRVALVPSAGE